MSKVGKRWSRINPFRFCDRYQHHRKLVLHHHYVVYFYNDSKHIEDIVPEIRKSMIMEKYESDVVFVVEGCKFPAHKGVLRMSNEKFFIENIATNPGQLEIVINGVDPKGFQQFLSYCQFGDLQLNPLNMMETYDVARRYEHSVILNICTSFICKHVEVNNVLKMFDWNLKHQQHKIMQTCRRFFIENAIEVLTETEDFYSISKELLKVILSLEILNCSEMLLFNKTIKWTEQQCITSGIDRNIQNKMNIVEDLLYLFRLNVSENLEVFNDFSINPRLNYFHKRRFDNLTKQINVEATNEELQAVNDDSICYGFSLILSNPDLKPEAFEHFLMTIETVNKIVFQKEFKIIANDYLVFKDFVFEDPLKMKRDERYFLKIKFSDSSRTRYMEKDVPNGFRILRLYDY